MSTQSSSNHHYIIECYARPGLSWSVEKQRAFVTELREVAMQSFGFTHESQLPAYQCLLWPDEAPTGAGLDDKVIAVARERVPPSSKRPGKMLAFNSAVLLPIPGLSVPVLHHGLTCILPSARSYGLTKIFTGHICMQTFLRCAAPRGEKLWITSVACVVSSLGSIAQGFKNVWPSPTHPHTPPTVMHAHIANSIAASPSLRAAMYISPECVYDIEKSVFQGSVQGTVFAKERDDVQYHHRQKEIHRFFESRIDFKRGDEVLQVWSISHVSELLDPLRGRWELSAKL